MAVFHRISEKEFCNIGIENLFKTIVKYEYPFRIDNRSDEEKILDEAAYYIRYLSYQNEDMEEEVPLNVLINMLKSFHISTNTLQTILEDGGWTVENHESGPVVLVPPISTFSDDSAVLSEIAQFNDHSDLYSDEDWPGEAGPPINCNGFLRQESSDIWSNENWNEESIVIPQNNSIPNNNTYLFDEENVLLNNESETIRNTEIFERDNEINDEENLNPLSNIDNFNNSFYNTSPLHLNESTELNPNSLTRKFEDVKEDSFFYIVSDAQNDPTSSTAQKLNRTLDIPVYMSVSRASTSPEPYLLHAIKMDQDLKNDSMCNQSMSNHWMLNNSFEQVNVSIDAITDTNDTKHNKSLEYNFDDHLHNKYLNISYKENKDSDIEYLDNNTNTSTNCFNQSKVQNDRQNSKISRSNSKIEDESDNIVVTNNVLIENRPQFTSSPKIEIKMNNMRKKRRSLDYDEQKNDSSSNITQKSQLINDSSNNLSENNKILSQSNKNINIFTMSDSYSNTIKENYNEDTSMYPIDVKIKNENQSTNNSNQNIFIDSNAMTIASTLNNDIQMAEELLEANFMSSNNSKKRTTASVNSIVLDQNKWPDSCITENIAKEQKELPILNINNIQSINCDTQFSLKNQLMIKSESQIDIYNNDELDNNHDLKNIKNVNNTEVSSNHAKDITNLENIPLVSSLHIEDEKNIQFTVLKSEERSECNIENLESKYKNINPNIVEVIESIELKSSSPEIVETPPKSWSPEIIDSGYPNSASAQDMTPEYDLPSIAQDHISESESPSIAEVPEVGMLEVIEVENGDLANNNRDGEGNNMIAAELNDLEDLQPLIEVLENDIENENDIYAIENDFPIWLLRILNMANPIDVEIHMRDHRELRFPNRVAGNYLLIFIFLI